MGIHTTGPAVQNRISSEMARGLQCIELCTIRGSSASSSSTTLSPTSPSSSSQDSVFDVNRYAENPVPESSGSTSGELRGDPLHETTETENKDKHGESEEVQRDISHELPE